MNTSKPAFNNHLNLFQINESDISTTNSVYIPVYSITNIHENQVPLEFNVCLKLFFYKLNGFKPRLIFIYFRYLDYLEYI